MELRGSYICSGWVVGIGSRRKRESRKLSPAPPYFPCGGRGACARPASLSLERGPQSRPPPPNRGHNGAPPREPSRQKHLFTVPRCSLAFACVMLIVLGRGRAPWSGPRSPIAPGASRNRPSLAATWRPPQRGRNTISHTPLPARGAAILAAGGGGLHKQPASPLKKRGRFGCHKFGCFAAFFAAPRPQALPHRIAHAGAPFGRKFFATPAWSFCRLAPRRFEKVAFFSSVCPRVWSEVCLPFGGRRARRAPQRSRGDSAIRRLGRASCEETAGRPRSRESGGAGGRRVPGFGGARGITRRKTSPGRARAPKADFATFAPAPWPEVSPGPWLPIFLNLRSGELLKDFLSLPRTASPASLKFYPPPPVCETKLPADTPPTPSQPEGVRGQAAATKPPPFLLLVGRLCRQRSCGCPRQRAKGNAPLVRGDGARRKHASRTTHPR
ncbi:uncharacterized protein Tco025E_09972 [Trypanosoma conorhini]|uniref:Uncharacterized protein n=1 Tax=Trypanosoma conorhini TaxID=83891 RepID=A0A422MQW3_9TRYP|nr:uncharacterized protein Tco025E_09972 [Trypanosoma conorhini]RNE95599.1 hypothetical protein Tco025E_09972 [Trypanosoma conorhini]